MIQALLSSILLLAQPADVDGAPEDSYEVAVAQNAEPMSETIARARLKRAMDHATPFEERSEMLAEIVARCEDTRYQTAAAYNLGISFIKNKPDNETTLQDAIEWLRRADIEGADPKVRARARDSIGHARYLLANAESDAESQITNPGDLNAMKQKLIDRMTKLLDSASAFRSAHDASPAYRESTENLERVRREIRELRQQIEALEDMIEQQEQDQQQRQQQQQEAAERLDELAEQQQQEANENSQRPQQMPQEQQQQQEDQASIGDQTESEQEGLQQQQEDQVEELQQVQEQLQRARDAQQRAQDALERGDAEEASQAQEEAAEALRDAAEQLRELSESQGEGKSQGEQEGQPADQESQDQGESEESEEDQISEIARQLLEKERREREARNVYRSTGRPVPVERDW